VHVVQLNYAYETAVGDPWRLVERYATLRGWSGALLAAGASRCTVAQRFARDVDFECAGVQYVCRADGGPGVADATTDPAALHAAVARLRPDLVHVNGLVFPAQLRQLRESLRPSCPIVVQDHAGVQPGRRRWWDPRARRAAARLRDALAVADAFMFTASAQADAWRAAGILAGTQPVFEVPESSTDLRPLPRHSAIEASGVEGDPAVLWVGRLDGNKDPLTVLDGFDRLCHARPEARLTMVYGEDGLIDDVRRRLKGTPSLASTVRLRGRVPHEHMAACFSAADVFVVGSHHEGSGYALIEALACGVVPAVTDIPPFRVLAGAAPSAFWPPGDARACAVALARGADAVSNVSREMIRAHFASVLSWEAIGRRAMDAYRAVLERKGPGV